MRDWGLARSLSLRYFAPHYHFTFLFPLHSTNLGSEVILEWIHIGCRFVSLSAAYAIVETIAARTVGQLEDLGSTQDLGDSPIMPKLTNTVAS